MIELRIEIVFERESAGAYAPLFERSPDELDPGEKARLALARASARLAVLAGDVGRPEVADPLIQHLRHVLGPYAERVLDEAREEAHEEAHGG